MKARKLGVFFGALLLGSICLADSLVGKSAPEITIREWVTENPPNVKNLAGRVYIVEFWATWCHSCVETIPHLIELNNKYTELGAEFIALSEDKSAEQIHQFVHQKQINYHVAIDNGTANWFGIRGYPTVVVVNHLGKVVWEGYPWDLEFEKAIDKAVAAGPPPLLAGIDLGPFNHLREPLCGGKEFAEAYHKIESGIEDNEKPERSAVAKQIVENINLGISQKLSEADHIRTTNPLKAYNIYADIISKYDGIEVVEPAKTAYLELKNCETLKNQLTVKAIAKETK